MARLSRLWLVLIAFAAVGISATAAGQSATCKPGYKVYFANGIYNDANNAFAAQSATTVLIGPRYNGMPITYDSVFHSENDVGNITTAVYQKISTDPQFAWASGSILAGMVLDLLNGLPLSNSLQQLMTASSQNALATAVTNDSLQAIQALGLPGNAYFDSQTALDVDKYSAALAQGYEILVVAHSQGNLYVDAAYRKLFSTNSNVQNSFSVLSVATPDAESAIVSSFGGKPAYINYSNDLVIGAVHAASSAVPAPSDAPSYSLTAAVGCSFSLTLPDCSGHTYLRTYLNGNLPFRDQIRQMAIGPTGLLSSLTSPPPSPSCVVIASLNISPSAPTVAVSSSVTLTVTATNTTGYPIPIPPNLVWQSGDTVIAGVSAGVVTGISPGSATITVTDPATGVKASVVVTVGNVGSPPPPATTVTLTVTPSTILIGQSAVVSWTSTNANSCATSGFSTSTATTDSISTGPLSSSATYTVTCTNSTTLDSATDTKTVTVTPLPTVVLTANPTNVVSGASSTLTWSSPTAVSCAAVGGWTNSTANSGSAPTGALVANATFQMICTDASGNQSLPASVTVTVGPVPTVTLTANPTTVASGGSATLSWTATNAASCTANGGWTNNTATIGTASTGALTATTTYSMTCHDANGNASAPASATVSITTAAMVNLSAYPESVISGDTSTISWTSVGATTCTAVGGWTTSTATSGTVVTGPLTADTTFTMTCADASGSQSAPSTVKVTIGTDLPTLYITASPNVVASGSNTVIGWVSSNATSCTASGGWTSSTAVANSVTVGPINSTTKYTMTCTGAAYSVTTSTVVQVSNAPNICIPPAGATTCAVTQYSEILPTYGGVTSPLATAVTTTSNGVSNVQQLPLGAAVYENDPTVCSNDPNAQFATCLPPPYHYLQICAVDKKWIPVTYSGTWTVQNIFLPNQTGCTGSLLHTNTLTGYVLTASGQLTLTNEQNQSENYACTSGGLAGNSDSYSGNTLNTISLSLLDGSGSASESGSASGSGTTGSVTVNTTYSIAGSVSWPAETVLPPQFLNTNLTATTTTYSAGQALPQACTVGTP